MSFIPDLFVLQSGAEAATDSWGTTKAATVKLMGIMDAKFDPQVDVSLFSQLRGSQAPGFETAVAKVGASASVDGLVSYQDIAYLFDALFGKATAVESVASTDAWDRSYNAPLSVRDSDLAAPTLSTLIYGDLNTAPTSSNTFAMNGATLVSMSLSGEDGAPITFSAAFFGKQVIEGALVSLADRAINVAMGDHVSLCIDPSSDAAGTTAVAATAFSFNMNINTNRAPVYHLGSLTASGYRDAKWAGSLSLSMEVTAVTRAYLSDILAASPSPVEKVIRLRIADTTVAEYVIEIDFVGVVASAPTVHDDIDGVSSVSLTLTGKYQLDQAGWLDVLVSNLTQTLA